MSCQVGTHAADGENVVAWQGWRTLPTSPVIKKEVAIAVWSDLVLISKSASLKQKSQLSLPAAKVNVESGSVYQPSTLR